MADITLYGAGWCSDCRRSRALLDGLGVAYDYVDVEASAENADAARTISGRTSIPVIAFPDGAHQVEPTDDELRGKLGELSLV